MDTAQPTGEVYKEVRMQKAIVGNEGMVRLEDGEKLIGSLSQIGMVSAVLLNGVGMLRDVKLGYWDGSQYVTEEIEEPVELLSLQGNVATREGEKIIHCHATVAKRGGDAFGGHVVEATVHNTVESFLYELSEINLERQLEPSGLAGLYPRTNQT